mmetsp:Transcript_71638/g.232937  ORF Transcript_71638/g.232937 Transcript_71638/m.232937 type:complete len:153 (+) Transcript_71638:110-568(+)
MHETVAAGASRQIAAAVAAALWRLLSNKVAQSDVGRVAEVEACTSTEIHESIVNNVDARMSAIAPGIVAQEVGAQLTGSAPRPPSKLLPAGDLRANVAKHAAFGMDFDTLSIQQMRRLQRGVRRQRDSCEVAVQTATDGERERPTMSPSLQD